MDKVAYWKTIATQNWKTTTHLFETRRYAHALFFGHFYLEALLKALIVHRTGQDAPYGHKLYALALHAGLNLTEKQHDLLTRVTAYNIKTRYPDERLLFYKRLNRRFTEAELNEIHRIGRWIASQIK